MEFLTMKYEDQVRNVLITLLPTLESNYTYYKGVLKGIRKVTDVKNLNEKHMMFITEVGKLQIKK